MAAWTWLTEHWTELVAAVGAAIVLARLIVKLTPTPKDDSALEKIVNFLKAIGLHIPDN